MSKGRSLIVKGTSINVVERNEQDFISLTDMVKGLEGGLALIEQWLKNKDTVIFLGLWEKLNNPNFNSLEFEGIRNEAGRNSFYLSAKKWVSTTSAIRSLTNRSILRTIKTIGTNKPNSTNISKKKA